MDENSLSEPTPEPISPAPDFVPAPESVPEPIAPEPMPDPMPDPVPITPVPDPAIEPAEVSSEPVEVSSEPAAPVETPKAVLPEGYPPDWPMFKAREGFSEDFSDIVIPVELRQVLSAEQAMGLHRIYFNGDNGPELFYVKEPKIAALEELFLRVADYEALAPEEKAKPAGMKQALAIVLPLLLRPDPVTRKRRKATMEEAAEVMGLSEIDATFARAFPASRSLSAGPLLGKDADPKA